MPPSTYHVTSRLWVKLHHLNVLWVCRYNKQFNRSLGVDTGDKRLRSLHTLMLRLPGVSCHVDPRDGQQRYFADPELDPPCSSSSSSSSGEEGPEEDSGGARSVWCAAAHMPALIDPCGHGPVARASHPLYLLDGECRLVCVAVVYRDSCSATLAASHAWCSTSLIVTHA